VTQSRDNINKIVKEIDIARGKDALTPKLEAVLATQTESYVVFPETSGRMTGGTILIP
jgi:hypothetical protein